jgi:hypothetical protein
MYSNKHRENDIALPQHYVGVCQFHINKKVGIASFYTDQVFKILSRLLGKEPPVPLN